MKLYPAIIKKSVFITVVMAMLMPFIQGCGEVERAANLYTEAIILNDTAEKEQAIEKLKEAIKVHPEFSLAHSMLGDVYFETGQFESSEESYEKATKLNEFSFHDFFNLGKVRYVLQKFADSAKAYVRACQLEPENADAHYQAARSFFQVRDDETAMDSAMEYGLTAQELDPNSGEIVSLLGNIYQKQNDNFQAIASYKRALELEGNDPDIMIPLAVSYFRIKKNDSAREVLESVLEIDVQNSLAYRYLGVYYIRANEFELALENYLMATQFNPNDWDAHKGLGVAYMLRSVSEDDDEARAMAIQHWENSLVINPNQPKLSKLLKKYSK